MIEELELQSLLIRARIEADQGAFERALQTLDKAIASAPRCAVTWFETGCVLGEMGELDEAIEALDHATSLDASFSLAHFQKGLFLMQLGRAEDARVAFGRSIELSPSFAEEASESLSIPPPPPSMFDAQPPRSELRPQVGTSSRALRTG